METIEQRIERRADKYSKELRSKGHSVNSTIGGYNGYIKGATDQQEIFDKLPKIKAWVARDKDGDIYMYNTLAPEKNGYYWVCQYGYLKLTEDQLPEGCNPKWEDEEPVEVELTINLKKG